MVYIFALLLIVCGALAASALIIKKRPDAAEMLAKVAPAQGTLGAILGLWSLWNFISLLMNMSTFRLLFSLGGKAAFFGLVSILVIIVGVVLGFLLAYALLDKFVLSKNPAAAEKGAAMRMKLTGIQIPLGMTAIVLGLLYIILVVSL